MKATPLLVAGALGALSITAAHTASAASCTYTATDMQDSHYSSLWGCAQSRIDDMWDRFDFDKGDWDEGFGYHDPCNNDKPLKRTFNALQLMAYGVTSSPTCSTSSSNVAQWAYCWSGNEIDELDGRCSNGDARATTKFGPLIDQWTRLYMNFFYNETVVERAGTIFHEARHAHGWCSHKESGCPSGSSSCDKNWSDGCTGTGSGSGKGAYAYQVLFLNWFATSARSSWINSTIRANAVSEANRILNSKFQSDPCFRLNSSGYTYSTC